MILEISKKRLTVIICLLLSYLFNIIFGIFKGWVEFLSIEFIFETVSTITLTLYCLNVLDKKKNDLLYVVGLTTYIIVLFSYISNSAPIAMLLELVLIVICIVLIIVKSFTNKNIIYMGNVSILIYLVLFILLFLTNLPYYLFEIFSGIFFLKPVSLFLLWWNDKGYLIKHKNTIFESLANSEDIKKRLIENRKLFDAGNITEQEFNEEKEKILNILWENDDTKNERIVKFNFDELNKIYNDKIKPNLTSKNKVIFGITIVLVLICSGVLFVGSNKYSVKKQISFVEDVFLTNDKNELLEKYSNAKTDEDTDDLVIQGYFSNIEGYYEIRFKYDDEDEVRNISFEWDGEKNDESWNEIKDKISEYFNDTFEYRSKYDYYILYTENFEIYLFDDSLIFYYD